MVETGIRDLRNHLSKYIDRVRAGEEVIVTDRGKAVARIVSAAGPRAYDRLLAEGLIEPAAATQRTRPSRRLRTAGPVSPLVGDQRR